MKNMRIGLTLLTPLPKTNAKMLIYTILSEAKLSDETDLEDLKFLHQENSQIMVNKIMLNFYDSQGK